MQAGIFTILFFFLSYFLSNDKCIYIFTLLINWCSSTHTEREKKPPNLFYTRALPHLTSSDVQTFALTLPPKSRTIWQQKFVFIWFPKHSQFPNVMNLLRLLNGIFHVYKCDGSENDSCTGTGNIFAKQKFASTFQNATLKCTITSIHDFMGDKLVIKSDSIACFEFQRFAVVVVDSNTFYCMHACMHTTPQN